MLGNQVPLILEATENVYKPLLIILYWSETGTSIVVVRGPRPSNCSIKFTCNKDKLVATQAVGE